MSLAVEPTGPGSCWDVQNVTKASDKAHGRKMWRPWGTKRGNAASETVIEEIKYPAVSSDMEGASKRLHRVGETIAEEKRVAISCSSQDGRHDQCTTMSVGRASMPWHTVTNESALEESFGSDVSSIPGLASESSNGDEDCHDDLLEKSVHPAD